MPMIHYSCSNCDNTMKKIFRSVKPIPSTLICGKCNGSMKRILSTPSSSSKISIDNGVQARAVEIVPNIIEINEERSKKNYRED